MKRRYDRSTLVLALSLAWFLAACGSPSQHASGPCGGYVPQGRPVMLPNDFPAFSLPGQTLAAPMHLSYAVDLGYSVWSFLACTPQTDQHIILATFQQNQGASWQASFDFPTDGQMMTECQYCLIAPNQLQLVMLDQIVAHPGDVITYRISGATAPTPVTCYPDPTGMYTYARYLDSLDAASQIPAPPLTKNGISTVTTADGITQRAGKELCSSGSASTIGAFFGTELTKLGWSQDTLPETLAQHCASVSGSAWYKGTLVFTYKVTGSADASASHSFSAGIFWNYSICQIGG